MGDEEGSGSCDKDEEHKLVNNVNKLTVNGDSTLHDLDLVEDKLYIGNIQAACSMEILKEHHIKYILTVDSCPLPAKIMHLPFVKTKFVQLCDIPREDIICHLDNCYAFLEEALSCPDEDSNVLVHCYSGVSRSATIALAYVMKKYEITLEEALIRLRQHRKEIEPNKGFMLQLKLFEKMGYKTEKNNVFYKRYRLYIAAGKIKAVKLLAPPYTDVIKSDPGVCTVNPEPVTYRCRKCRRILASASNLLLHTEKQSPHWYDFDEETEDKKICSQMYFVEPLNWMDQVAHSMQGKLHCPNQNCKSKLGSFSWIMGYLCPCGAKVQPAFYLVPSKVDRSTSVLNVQITI